MTTQHLPDRLKEPPGKDVQLEGFGVPLGVHTTYFDRLALVIPLACWQSPSFPDLP